MILDSDSQKMFFDAAGILVVTWANFSIQKAAGANSGGLSLGSYFASTSPLA